MEFSIAGCVKGDRLFVFLPPERMETDSFFQKLAELCGRGVQLICRGKHVAGQHRLITSLKQVISLWLHKNIGSLLLCWPSGSDWCVALRAEKLTTEHTRMLRRSKCIIQELPAWKNNSLPPFWPGLGEPGGTAACFVTWKADVAFQSNITAEDLLALSNEMPKSTKRKW